MSLLGFALLSRNNVVYFLVYNCSYKCMVRDGSGKLEESSLAKTENIFRVVKSFVLLLVFSC